MSQPRSRPVALVFSLVLVLGLLSSTPAASVQASSLTSTATPQYSAAALKAAAIANEKGPPVMQQAAQLESTAAPGHFTLTSPSTTRIAQSAGNPRLFREVFGFAFASSLGDATIGYPTWNFGLLSTVAYFALHVDWSGALVNDSGMARWNDPNGPTPGFIATAHANGTKVVVTIVMDDSTAGTPNMCSALRYGATTVSETVSQVIAKHIDGVNVDYESNNATCPASGALPAASSQSLFTAFVKNLRAALPSGSYLTVDTYSGSAGYRSGLTYFGFYDISALASYVDAFFVMAYDMEFSNSAAAPLNCSGLCIGPTAPLTTYLYNDSRASSEYRAVVTGSKIIMGIPYYGRKVCVSGVTPTTAPPNAPASGSATPDGYLDASTENGYSANTNYQIHREVHDTAGQTRWDTFTSSTAACTRELYWDDVTALGDKYNLIINDGLRGAGIFALNYGGGAPELWSLINHKFGQCSNAAITSAQSSPQIPGTQVTFNATAFCAGTPEYRFWTEPPGGGWSVAQAYSTSASVIWDTTGKPLGTYHAEVDARNLGSSVSYDTTAQIPFRLALCVTPTLTPDHASPQLLGTQVTFTAAVTCQGTPEYRFWVQPPGGAWSIAQDYGGSPTFSWNTSGLALGNYNVEVDVRTQGTTVSYESDLPMTYSLTSCINPALAMDKTSPQPTGTLVNLTASASCAGTNAYRFWVRPPGGSWTIARDYGSAATFAWNAGDPGGDYGLEVDVKSATAPNASMVHANADFTLTSCTAATLAVGPGSPQVPGTPVTLTGGATCDGVAQYTFLTRAPGGPWTVVQAYGPTNTFTWNTTGLPTGTYGLEVEARNPGATSSYETAMDVDYTLAAQACTTPTLTSDLASPQGTGGRVTFTAGTTTCPNPLYRFWVQPPAGSWTLMQDYAGASTFAWSPSGGPGTYGVEVDVRDASRSIVAYDAVANITYDLVACASATLATAPVSPQPPALHVTLTGAATCSGTPQYRFWVRAPGGSWTMIRDYGSAAAFSWDTTSKPSGTYGLEVDVRDAGASAPYETTANISYVLTPPCTKPALTPNPSGPQPVGVPVSFTGATTACANPQYRFWLRPPGGSWSVVQDYSSNAVLSWSGGTAVGTYGVEVDVRSQGSPVLYDAVDNVSYSVTAVPPCTGATISGSPASTTGTGVPVTFTGVATGCTAAQYRFWTRAPGGSWTIARDYSSSNTYGWPGGGAAGAYQVEVDVRSLGSTVSYDAHANTTYTLVGCGAGALSADHTSPQPSGTTVVFTGAAACTGTPTYRFWVKAPGGSWKVVQDYGTSATFSWTTAGLVAGTYSIEVDVRDQGSTASYETVFNTTFTLQ